MGILRKILLFSKKKYKVGFVDNSGDNFSSPKEVIEKYDGKKISLFDIIDLIKDANDEIIIKKDKDRVTDDDIDILVNNDWMC